jgi:hypothetical protein
MIRPVMLLMLTACLIGLLASTSLAAGGYRACGTVTTANGRSAISTKGSVSCVQARRVIKTFASGGGRVVSSGPYEVRIDGFLCSENMGGGSCESHTATIAARDEG